MSTFTTTALPKPRQSIFQWIGDHWFETFLIVYGLWVFAPFLAPIFMQLGWTGAGKAIYFIYSFFCHQLPERSYFLFGEKSMYSLSEIQSVWQDTTNRGIHFEEKSNHCPGGDSCCSCCLLS
jgi:hypothetical protein